MKCTVTLLTSLLCITPALSADFDAGICHLSSGGYGVRPTGESSCYRPVFSDAVTKDDFLNLQVGDGIEFSGELSTATSIDIDSIASVSLYRLLGGWKDSKNRYYNFSDYSTLVVYDPASPNVAKAETFSYELYPNSALRWGISMASVKSNRVGLLRQFSDRYGELHFEICLYQDNTPARKRVCSTLTRPTN